VAELGTEGKRDKAARVMEDLLQSHPELAGVFGINDDTALGALAAIESAGKRTATGGRSSPTVSGTIKIVGYDATPEAREKIKAGAIYGDVIQNPREIGAKAIQAVKEILEGRMPPAVIPVEVGVFTRES
jgi:ABC-type sugar transport system substrate-binding protein